VSAAARNRLGLVLTIGIWLIGYGFGRLSGLVDGLREGHAARPGQP
jgi:hypothetical protein